MALDKNYKLQEFTSNQTVSKNSYTTVLSVSGKGLLDCIVFKVSDTDMDLIITIDGSNVIDGFNLKSFSSDYDLETKQDYNLPLTSIGSKTFRYSPREFQEFTSNVTVQLKHRSKSNKELNTGYITFGN